MDIVGRGLQSFDKITLWWLSIEHLALSPFLFLFGKGSGSEGYLISKLELHEAHVPRANIE